MSRFTSPGSQAEDMRAEMFTFALGEDDDIVAYRAMIERLRLENESLRREVRHLSDFRTLAYRDALTGLYNRRHFEERLAEEWSRADRYDAELTLIIIDLDNFKAINDTAGHGAGDAVLELVASVMLETCRECDIPCRLGGDELSYILPNTDRTGATKLCARLRTAIRDRAAELSLPPGLSVELSCGIATFADAASASAMKAFADDRMYAEKRARKSAA